MRKIDIKADVLFFIRCIVTSFLRLIPKKKNLVVFSAWFGEKYIDNTKYLYEYLLSDPNYNVYWITKNKSVFLHLKGCECPVALSSSLKGIYLQLRAQVCFSTVQFSDFNSWLVGNSIYIDLGHGNMIKDPGEIIRNPKGQRVERYLLKTLDYYAIIPSEYAKHYYQQVVRVSEDRIFISDFARNDVFIDSRLREGKNQIVDRIARDRRKIVYMPTHRSDGKIRLNLEAVLPLDEIEQLCRHTNSVFFIKRHFYHRNERMDLSAFTCIFDITDEETIDPQVLLFQADILVTDYSSCFIDYLLLNRPIVFFQFDYDYYIHNERSLFIDFKTANFAPVTYDSSSFVQSLYYALVEGNSDYKDNLKKITSLFFDNPSQTGGREKDKSILDYLVNRH